MNKVIVIGGGAAGLMAALSAAEAEASVLLLEGNEKLGKKIYITGKGRCNVTNACEPAAFMNKVVKNPRFLFSALNALCAGGHDGSAGTAGLPGEGGAGRPGLPGQREGQRRDSGAGKGTAAARRVHPAEHEGFPHFGGKHCSLRCGAGRRDAAGSGSGRRGHRRCRAIPPPAPRATASVGWRSWGIRSIRRCPR